MRNYLAALLLCTLLAVSASAQTITDLGSTERVQGLSYRLDIAESNGRATLSNADGTASFSSFDLFASLPYQTGTFTYGNWRQAGGKLLVDVTKSGTLYQTIAVAPDPNAFETQFTLYPGRDSGSASAGLNLLPNMTRTGWTQTFSPSPQKGTLNSDGNFHFAGTAQIGTGIPSSSALDQFYFAPGPLDMEAQTAAGWMGIGMANLTDAANYNLNSTSVYQDVPWNRIAGSMGTNPYQVNLLFTFPTNEWQGLRTWSDELASRGYVQRTTLTGNNIPSWWKNPIFCTWGEQDNYANQTSASHGGWDPHWFFNTAWVRDYYMGTLNSSFGPGLQAPNGGAKTPVTLVIDDNWQSSSNNGQADASDPNPNFAGLRQLIDDQHALGNHVLLWVKMWSFAGGSDPSASGAQASIRSWMQQVLGSGSGRPQRRRPEAGLHL